MSYITTPTAREARRSARGETFRWQKAALGLLALSTAVNAAQCAAISSLGRQSRDWETKYQAVAAIKRDAIEAYGDLIRETERDKRARQEQAEAYEAIGAWEYVGECTVTAYCPCEACCGRWADGMTATGVPATPGVAAVDPSVIPLGSTIIIDGQQYLAADTGVTGNHVDICMADHAEAADAGIRTEKVWVIKP